MGALRGSVGLITTGRGAISEDLGDCRECFIIDAGSEACVHIKSHHTYIYGIGFFEDIEHSHIQLLVSLLATAIG